MSSGYDIEDYMLLGALGLLALVTLPLLILLLPFFLIIVGIGYLISKIID